MATGVGAAGGGATGACRGPAGRAGPVGGVIGAVIGAVAGGFGGSAVGEAADPTIIDEPTADRRRLPRRAVTGHGKRRRIRCRSRWPLGTPRNRIPFSGRRTPPRPVRPGQPSLSLRPRPTISEPTHEEIAVRAWSYFTPTRDSATDGHGRGPLAAAPKSGSCAPNRKPKVFSCHPQEFQRTGKYLRDRPYRRRVEYWSRSDAATRPLAGGVIVLLQMSKRRRLRKFSLVYTASNPHMHSPSPAQPPARNKVFQTHHGRARLCAAGRRVVVHGLRSARR